jgi:hypothetical protein
VQRVDLQIRQRAILGAIGNFISQTLFPSGIGAPIYCRKTSTCSINGFAEIFDPIDDLSRSEVTLHDHGHVSFHRWKSRKRMDCDSPRSILKQFFEVSS